MLNMNQFLYFITNPGNESFLKKEIELNPELSLNFSFSKPGLCTFKNTNRPYTLSELKSLSFAYARAWGESIGMFKTGDETPAVAKDFTRVEIPINALGSDTDILYDALEIEEGNLEVCVQLENGDKFIGKQLLDKYESPMTRMFYDISKTDAPSRAYHKIKEACLLTNLKLKGLSAIEFGCAPGGASKFLLDAGVKVVGVDPADMDDSILAHKDFQFIKEPIQNVTTKMFPKQVDLLISDVNLNPDVVLKQCHGIFKSNAPKYAFITLKTPKVNYLNSFPTWKKYLEQMGYTSIDFVQLSSHRKECLAIGMKN